MRHRRLVRGLALGVTVLLVPALASAPVDAAPSWQRYIVGPPSRDVRPVAVTQASGDVTNPQGVLGAGVTTLRRPPVPAKTRWPAGTTATASSSHAPNNGNDGRPRTYDAANAVDGDTGTFWNDDTLAAYPDSLTISTPSTALPGITLQSSSDGVPQDFTVDTWDGAAWHTAATVTGNTKTQLAVPFDRPVTTTQVRLTVTKDQATDKGEFTRVNELWPGLVADPPAPSLVVDFGKVVVGYPKLAFDGASTGNPGVRLAFSETQQYLTDRSDFTRSDFAGGPGTDQHAVPGGRSQWTDTKGCQSGNQVCADGLHGFRYVRISLDALPGDAPAAIPNGEVRLDDVSLLFTGVLGTPAGYTGWFESSDEELNRYWYGAAYTNELVTDTFRATDVEPRNAASPSLEGKLVLHDGAKRDRDPYVGDVGVSGRTTYLTHDTAAAARNVLADLADHQRADGWIPPASINNYTLPLFDYPLWWVTSSWDYVLYTGDTAYGSKYYAELTKTLDGWYPSMTDARGLLSRPSGYGDYAFLPREGEVTYYNALYVQALTDAAQLARSLNRPADADRWSQRASAVSSAINTDLWDPAAGAYLDAATGPVRHGQDGNSIAVVAGVADPARTASALGYLAQHTALPYGNSFMDNDSLIPGGSQRVYAFTSYPELQARFRSGQAGSAIDEIKRMYGAMAAHDPGVTDWEGIGPGGSMYDGAYTSAAHGWSTGVLPALTNGLLGVTPASPGFATFTVEPHPGPVAWARGQVPTPHGPITVSWQKTGSSIALTVTAPPGTHARIRLGDRQFTATPGTHSYRAAITAG
jgi:hypothetical protein